MPPMLGASIVTALLVTSWGLPAVSGDPSVVAVVVVDFREIHQTEVCTTSPKLNLNIPELRSQ